MANLEAEAVVMAEVITMDTVTTGLIIEAITTINTISRVGVGKPKWPLVFFIFQLHNIRLTNFHKIKT